MNMEGLNHLVTGLQNPTGGKIRMDPEGSGLFGASRGARAHAGLDLECNPGQEIVSPHPGYAKRIAYPYKDHQYEGIEIVHDMFISHLYYLHVSTKLIGKQIEGDQVVGIAQDICNCLKGGHEHRNDFLTSGEESSVLWVSEVYIDDFRS